MDQLPAARTQRSGRRRHVGWTVGSVSLVVLLLAFVGASAVSADHVIDLGASGTDQSGTCTGDYFKIEDADVLEEGTHTYTGTTKDGGTFSAVLTVVLDGDGEVDSITVVSVDPPASIIVFKAGNAFGIANGNFIDASKAISNVAFCLDVAPTPTAT
jgi:hypothetical protein